MGLLRHEAIDGGAAGSVGYEKYIHTDHHTIGGVGSLNIIRSATFVVAANDAPASFKAMADYTCDGTADEEEVQIALDAVSSVGGLVLLSPGTFNVTATIVMPASVSVMGMGKSTLFQVTAGWSPASMQGVFRVADYSAVRNMKFKAAYFTTFPTASGDNLRVVGVHSNAATVGVLIENIWSENIAGPIALEQGASLLIVRNIFCENVSAGPNIYANAASYSDVVIDGVVCNNSLDDVIAVIANGAGSARNISISNINARKNGTQGAIIKLDAGTTPGIIENVTVTNVTGRTTGTGENAIYIAIFRNYNLEFSNQVYKGSFQKLIYTEGSGVFKAYRKFHHITGEGMTVDGIHAINTYEDEFENIDIRMASSGTGKVGIRVQANTDDFCRNTIFRNIKIVNADTASIKEVKNAGATIDSMTYERIVEQNSGATDFQGANPLPVQEAWFPATAHTVPAEDLQDVGNGMPGVLLDDAGEKAHISFKAPAEFKKLIAASIVVYPRATQAAANWDITSVYSAVGEARAIHTGSNTTSTYNVTDGVVAEVDISGILSSLAAGDHVGITLEEATAGHNLAVLGVKLRWWGIA